MYRKISVKNQLNYSFCGRLKPFRLISLFSEASNPCELNCVPRGENFFYRHRAAVVDGTPCHVGHICVDGACRVGSIRHDRLLGFCEHDIFVSW